MARRTARSTDRYRRAACDMSEIEMPLAADESGTVHANPAHLGASPARRRNFRPLLPSRRRAYLDRRKETTMVTPIVIEISRLSPYRREQRAAVVAETPRDDRTTAAPRPVAVKASPAL